MIAAGSSAVVPDLPGLDGVPWLTNETLFDLEEPPGHLIILGGGPIGLEMAQAHARLGCLVTVLEAAPGSRRARMRRWSRACGKRWPGTALNSARG